MGNPQEISEIERILDKVISSKILWLYLLLFIQILLVIVRFCFDFILKNKEKRNESFLLKEKNRISSNEKLYSKMIDLNKFLPGDDLDIYEIKINTIMKILLEEGLYINKKFKKIVSEFTDYHKSVLDDATNKSVEKENEFIDKFYNHFNK